ncbi:MAG: arylesterase [Kangiellaceae bacterium]|nr:arylesterase [Kangiellaceae bacterium]
MAKTNILVFGDSLSAAYNIQPENGWVSLLENKLASGEYDVAFTNASISGETSSGGLVRFLSQVNKSNPDILILELGANDGLRGSNLKTMRSNLQSMIKICQQRNISILLAGMHIPPNYGRTYTRKFDQIYLDLAKMDDVTLIPFFLEGVATKREFIQQDGMHPNEKAQPVIASLVEEYLLPLLRNKAE